MEPNAAWINKESSSPWELVQSAARRAKRDSLVLKGGPGTDKSGVATGFLLRPVPLSGGRPRPEERSDAKSLGAATKASPYPLRSRVSGSVRKQPNNEQGASGTPQSSRAHKGPATKKGDSGAGAGPSEPKPYNIARAEPAPARNAVHDMYTGVLASSLRLKDLLEKQHSHQSPQRVPWDAHGESVCDKQDALVEGTDTAVGARRLQGRVSAVARSQLTLLAHALVRPAGVKDSPVERSALGSQPRSGAAKGGAVATQRDRDGDEDGDVSMADLDAYLAAGEAKIQIELPAAGEPGPAGYMCAAKSCTSAPRRKEGAAAPGAPSSSRSCTPGCGSHQHRRLRCNSPLDLCRAVQNAQARAGMGGEADAAEAPSPAEAAAGLAAGAALTPKSHQAGATAEERCDRTPGSMQLRLQLPEPCPVSDLKAVPEQLQICGKRGRPGPSAAANLQEPRRGDAPPISAHGGTGAEHGTASFRIRSRSVSRLNPTYPSSFQPGRASAAQVYILAGSVGQSNANGAASAPNSALDGHHDVSLRLTDLVDGVQDGKRPWEGAPAGVSGSGTAQLGGAVAERTPALACPGAFAAYRATSEAAKRTDLAMIVSPTPSSPDTNPWLTIAQLAARATDTSHKRAVANTSCQPPEGNAAAAAMPQEPVGAAAPQAAASPGGAAHGICAADAGGEAAAAAVTIQLSAGDNEDDGAPSLVGEEQQQPAPGHLSADNAAGRRSVRFAEPPVRQPATERQAGRANRKGRGRGRGRGRLSSGTGAEGPKPAAGANRADTDGAPVLHGACTLSPASAEDGMLGGEESSPDVPIGKLAAAVPQLRRLPSCVAVQSVASLPGVSSTTPTASRRVVPLLSAPDSADLPIGVLAATATGAAGVAFTMAPEDLPGADTARAGKGCVAQSSAEQSSFAHARVGERLPGHGGKEEAPGAGLSVAGHSGAGRSVGATEPRKKRRKRKRRPSTPTKGSHDKEAYVADTGAASIGGAEGTVGRGDARSGALELPPNQSAVDMEFDVPATQAGPGLDQPQPQSASALPAGSRAQPSAGADHSANKSSDASSGVKLVDNAGVPLAPLMPAAAPPAPAEPAVEAQTAAVPAGRVQLGQMWKRQRVSGVPPPAALLTGPRFGMPGRTRPSASSQATPAALAAEPQPLQGEESQPPGSNSAGEAQGAPVQAVCELSAAEAEETLEQQLPPGQRQQVVGAPPPEPQPQLMEQHGGQVLGREEEEEDLEAQQPMPCDAGEGAIASLAAFHADQGDAEGSGPPLGREETPQAAANRVHIRSMWKRPRLAAALGGPMGRRALLGQRAGLTAAAAAVAAAPQSGVEQSADGAGPSAPTAPGAAAQHDGGEGKAAPPPAAAVVGATAIAARARQSSSAAVDVEVEIRLQPAEDAKSGGLSRQALSVGGGCSDGQVGPAASATVPGPLGAAGSGLADYSPRPKEKDHDHAPKSAIAAAPAAERRFAPVAANRFTAAAAAMDALHRTPPRVAQTLGVLQGPGPTAAAPSPRPSGGGLMGKPPRSPGDARLAGVPLSPPAAPSLSPSSRGAGASGHRLRDPSLHPAAVAGTAALSPIQPLLSKFQMAAVPSPRACVLPASAGAGMWARPPALPSPKSSVTAAAVLDMTATAAVTADGQLATSPARARSLLPLFAAPEKKRDRSAAETSFLQPLAPIRTKAVQPAAATTATAAAANKAAAGVKPSVVQVVEALLSIPRLGDDGSPNSADAAAADADGDVEMKTSAPSSTAPSADGSGPTVTTCALEQLLDVATRAPAAEPPSGHMPAALHSPLALLVDVAAAEQGGEETGSQVVVKPAGSASASASDALGREAQGGAGAGVDPPSEGPKPLRSAIRGIQRFFSALGPWAGMVAPSGARSSPVQSEPAGAAAPETAFAGAGGGGGGGSISLVCDERLELSSGKAASPLPPRPRPAGKPPTDGGRAVPGGSRLACRLSPSKPSATGQAESPVASVRPSDGYSTPPCGTGRSRPPGHGASGWPRSSAYPGHQYDSMIEDVVQQMLNEASPDGPPPLELDRPAACSAVASSPSSAAAVAREGVTGVVAHQAPVALRPGDENVPMAVNGVAPLVTAAGASSPQQTPPSRRSIYLRSPTGKRRRSPDAAEPPDAADAAGAGAAALGGATGAEANWLGGSEAAGAQQPEAPLVVGHRRRPRKAARVDGSSCAVAAAAAGAAAASDNMDMDDAGSEFSGSDDDMNDSYAVASGASRSSGRGPFGQAKTHGSLRGGPGRGPGCMFASRLMPYGPPGGSNWIKPGLAWSRVSGAAPPPGQHLTGPARASPQLHRPAFGPSRPLPTGAAGGSAAVRPASAGAPSSVLEPGSPGDSLLDVPRTLSLQRGAGSARRPNTYLSSNAEATNARPTLEQEYREALINSRLAQAWAAGERWARCDLAGLPADMSKRGVTERLAMLDTAASKLNCYRGAEGAAKIMAKVEEEWAHLKRIRTAAAARSTVRTPSGTTPSPAPGHFFAGRPPHTPLPFAAHAHAAAAAAAASGAAMAAVTAAAAPQAAAPGDGGAANVGAQQQLSSGQPEAVAVTATPPPLPLPAGAFGEQPLAEHQSEDPRAEQPEAQLPSGQQQQDAAVPWVYAAPGASGPNRGGLAEVVSAHGHAHCHRGSPPPPAAAPYRQQHTPSQPHHHHNHNHRHTNHHGNPIHHPHGNPHSEPHAMHRAGDGQQRPPAGAGAPHAHPRLSQDGPSTSRHNTACVTPQQQDDKAGAEDRGEAFGTPMPHNTAGAGEGRPVEGGERLATTPPPNRLGAEGGGSREASAFALRHPQQLQLTPPASILKTVPTPYTAGRAGAALGGPAAGGATPSGGVGGGGGGGFRATGGKKAVKFAAVLELGPQSGYRYTERPAPLPRPSFEFTLSQSRQQQEQQ